MATMWGKTAAICSGTVWGQRPMGPTQWAGGLDQRLVPRTQLLPGLSNKHRQLVWCLALQFVFFFFLLKIRQCQWLERTTSRLDGALEYYKLYIYVVRGFKRKLFKRNARTAQLRGLLVPAVKKKIFDFRPQVALASQLKKSASS